MPFLTYQVSTEEAIRNCGRVLQETGAQGVSGLLQCSHMLGRPWSGEADTTGASYEGQVPPSRKQGSPESVPLQTDTLNIVEGVFVSGSG